jgi:hypothetical protein
MADVDESCVINRRAFAHIPQFFAPILFFNKDCSSQKREFFVRGCGQESSAEAFGGSHGSKNATGGAARVWWRRQEKAETARSMEILD